MIYFSAQVKHLLQVARVRDCKVSRCNLKVQINFTEVVPDHRRRGIIHSDSTDSVTIHFAPSAVLQLSIGNSGRLDLPIDN